ncbi:MAG: hypothetical protein JO250_06510 [Armatimonadetes bacterium]|nr:hypothetical protein [Armatimonadota bacterium]
MGVITQTLIEQALGLEATHLYVEQQNTRCRIAVRLPDRSIQELSVVPAEERKALVDCFKELASLDVEDRRTPQYGCLTVGLPGGPRSFRIGNLPFLDARQRQRIVVWLTGAEA